MVDEIVLIGGGRTDERRNGIVVMSGTDQLEKELMGMLALENLLFCRLFGWNGGRWLFLFYKGVFFPMA